MTTVFSDYPFLRIEAHQVKTEEELMTIVNVLESSIIEAKSESVAAPQINLKAQVAIIRTDTLNLNIINPNIVSLKDKYINFNETCPSFPSIKLNCFRYRTIEFENDFSRNIVKLSGRDAALAQHEIDHLFRTLFTDRKIKAGVVRPNGEILLTDKCPCGSRKKFAKCCNVR